MSLCQVLEEVAGANILNDAILEPRRESLRARRRRGAYAEVLDELDEGSDDSDLDDFWYPTCLTEVNKHIDGLSHFCPPGTFDKILFLLWSDIFLDKYFHIEV